MKNESISFEDVEFVSKHQLYVGKDVFGKVYVGKTFKAKRWMECDKVIRVHEETFKKALENFKIEASLREL